MEGLYRNTLRTGWYIVWRNKFLWFFGLFTALLGATGEYDVIFQQIDAYTFQQRALVALLNNKTSGELTLLWNGLVDTIHANVGAAIGWSVLLIVLFALAYALSVLSQGALIYVTDRANAREFVNMDQAWHAGFGNFWRVLGVSLFGKVINWLLFLAAGIPLGYVAYTTSEDIWSLVLLLIVIFIFIPLSVVIAFTVRYALGYVVLRNEPVSHALSRGFGLFARNWIVSAEMALVLLAVNIFAAVILVFGVIVIAIPFIVFGLFMSIIGAASLVNIVIILAAIGLFVWIIFFGSMIAALQWTSWITLFEYLENGKAKSKLARIIDRLPEYFGRKEISN